MAHFHPPIPPVFVGGTAQQPYAPNRVPDFPGASIDNPPFSRRLAIAAFVAITLWQPDPWQYGDQLGPAGGTQPYGPRQLNASIAAVAGGPPPFTYGGPYVAQAVAVAAAQPDPWQYNNQLGPAGGTQPYAPRQLSPAIPGQSADPPPFDRRQAATKAALVALTQPDPWTFVFVGPVTGQQPYGARQLNPSITAVEVDNPPTVHPEQLNTTAVIKTAWQADPWVYDYLGPASGTQPYAPRQFSPGIPGEDVHNPPFTYGGPYAVRAEIVALAQPDPWTWVYLGPAFGTQPYAARLLPPALTAVAVNNPPFDKRSPQNYATLLTLAQPDPWVFNFGPGAPQPFGRAFLPPGPVASPPPFDQRLAQQRAELVGLNQPDPWVYVYLGPVGGTQPYGPKLMSPGIPGEDVDNPPFDRRYLELRAQLISFQQPDPWVYLFQGGFQPYAPIPINPIFEGLIAPIPGAGKKPSVTGIYPDAPYSKKPNKPFRPIWDIGGEVEKVAPPVAPAPLAIPLPPPSIFGAAPVQTAPASAANPLNLPTFDHLVPPDPVGLGKRVQEAQDLSDAIAVLKALGLIG